MQLQVSRRLSAVAILISCSGTILQAGAPTLDSEGTSVRAEQAPLDFRSARWIADRNVINANGDKIAQVSDLIIDRGSGRIDYLVLTTDTTFGLGGRAVVVPYADLRWDPATKDRLVLASTVDQLKALPEFTPKSWADLRQAPRAGEDELHRRLAADAAVPGDQFSGSLAGATKSRVDGKVRSVERVQTTTFGEQTQVIVELADGSTKKVSLGPSWFVNSSNAAPMRGDRIGVDALELPRDPDQMLAAVECRVGERSLKLREPAGTPLWTRGTVESDGQTFSAPYSRSMLASAVYKTPVDCRGSECGKVADLIVERESGSVAFVSIDPNQNFLGVGDTKRLIPWTVTNFAVAGSVRIDASKEMVLSSPETPADPTVLNAGSHVDRVYKAFDTKASRYNYRRAAASSDRTGSDSSQPTAKSTAWDKGGIVLAGIEPGSARSITGTVLSAPETVVVSGALPARTIRIRIAGVSEETVLLGPESYMARQKMQCVPGETVTLEVVRTQINSQPHWLARSMKHKGAQLILLSDDNTPAWSRP